MSYRHLPERRHRELRMSSGEVAESFHGVGELGCSSRVGGC
jgi:hypothetical protein